MPTAAPERPHFTRAVTELGERQGVFTTQPIFSAQGIKIVSGGVAVNKALYERLTQHQLSEPLENGLACANTVTAAGLRSAAEEVVRAIPFFGRMVANVAELKVLLSCIEGIPLPSAIALQLTVAREMQPELFQQLMRTALTAVWLARTSSHVSRFDLGMAAAAGMLHDIGMLHVDPLLLEPDQALDRHQRRQIYAHPLVSTTLLERHQQYPGEVVRAVGEHQEFLDGSGYPRNLVGDSISPLGKLLALAQVVAAMFAPGRSARELRLSVLLRMTTDLYDAPMAQRVLALLQPDQDIMSAETMRLEDPLGLLREVGRLLDGLSPALDQDIVLSDLRREGMLLVTHHATRIQRVLARVGATPDLLETLDDKLPSDAMHMELALLTLEASWQLRTLARHARRRWHALPGEEFPPLLNQWLDEVDVLVARVSGVG